MGTLPQNASAFMPQQQNGIDIPEMLPDIDFGFSIPGWCKLTLDRNTNYMSTFPKW